MMAHFSGPFDDFSDFGRTPAMNAHQRRCELRQDREFHVQAVTRWWMLLQQGQRATKVSHRFAIVRASSGLFSGLPPIGYRFGRSVGSLEVQGDDLRRSAVGGSLGQHRIGDACMDVPPRGPKKRGISSILHKGVLKKKGGLRKRSALKDQPLLDKP